MKVLRRTVLLSLAAVPLLRAKDSSFDSQRYNKFVHVLNQFDRELNGCPPTGYPPEIECLSSGKFNAKLWKELVVQSGEVFK